MTSSGLHNKFLSFPNNIFKLLFCTFSASELKDVYLFLFNLYVPYFSEFKVSFTWSEFGLVT